MVQLRRRCDIAFVDDDDICELNLLCQQLAQPTVVVVIVSDSAVAQLFIGCIELWQTLRIHDGDHGVEAGDVAEDHPGFIVEGKRFRNGKWFADASALDDQVVKATIEGQLFDLNQQVFTQRAANTAVVHLHHFCIHARDTIPQQCFINVDAGHVVDDDGDFATVVACQEVVENGCFACAKKAGEHSDGKAIVRGWSGCVHGVQPTLA